MIRSREGKVTPAAPDLLVCFPTRLIPKPICSSSDSWPRHRRKSSSRIPGGNGHGSPLLWAKSDVSEPTSPKVTCAGQIKVRAKPTACKNWQSVMEEIERIHNHRKQKRRSASWIESLGFKKDVMQFLSCLRNLRFDFRCFGGFPSDYEDDDEDEEQDNDDEIEEENRQSKEETDRNSNAVFSKWYMILQERNQGVGEFANPEGESKGKMLMTPCFADEEDESSGAAQTAPPPNALLLMRCRSAPAKNWPAPEEEKQETPSTNLGEDFSKLSEEIAKETWIVGGIREMLARSRSWKR